MPRFPPEEVRDSILRGRLSRSLLEPVDILATLPFVEAARAPGSARTAWFAGLLLALAALACGSSEEGDGATGTGGAGAGSTGAAGGADGGEGPHGCFSTETECDGKCVDLETHADHCGACGESCNSGPNQAGQCIAGSCVQGCQAGFVSDGGTCKNFLGAHQQWPAECPGCNSPNASTGDCSCPAGASDLALAVQSDCPGMPMRAATELRLCVPGGVSETSDFGGAYQVDDFEGWCGATAKCRVGNPLAGGACACPAGFDEAIGLRSIVRLCDASEGGTVIVLCGNKEASVVAFGGAYQLDDIAPNCRVPNPWTGDCTCPAGTLDRSHRIMVDGNAGLYGSSLHICAP
jgi:hypothetical protein